MAFFYHNVAISRKLYKHKCTVTMDTITESHYDILPTVTADDLKLQASSGNMHVKYVF